MTEQYWKTETDNDGITWLCLDTPDAKANVLSSAVLGELNDILDPMTASPPKGLVIWSGKSESFVMGADIKEFTTIETPERAYELVRLGQQLMDKVEALPCPSVTVINGVCMGGGLELAMGADLRYLADDARVGQPEILLGIIPGAGGTQRLPRLVGYQRALEMCMTGRQVDAVEAAEIGLADKVVPVDELFDTAMSDAVEFASGPTAAYAATKRAVAAGWGTPLDRGLDIEAGEFDHVFATNDARIGVAAFLAKEKPDFEGR